MALFSVLLEERSRLCIVVCVPTLSFFRGDKPTYAQRHKAGAGPAVRSLLLYPSAIWVCFYLSMPDKWCTARGCSKTLAACNNHHALVHARYTRTPRRLPTACDWRAQSAAAEPSTALRGGFFYLAQSTLEYPPGCCMRAVAIRSIIRSPRHRRREGPGRLRLGSGRLAIANDTAPRTARVCTLRCGSTKCPSTCLTTACAEDLALGVGQRGGWTAEGVPFSQGSPALWRHSFVTSDPCVSPTRGSTKSAPPRPACPS